LQLVEKIKDEENKEKNLFEKARNFDERKVDEEINKQGAK